MTADYAHIVKGCRMGDRRAQRALYDTFAPMLMGLCMRFAPDRDAAQDLLQEGFVKVFESIGQVKNPEVLKVWVYRVVLRVCLQQVRKERPTVVYAADEELEGVQLPLDPFGMEEIVCALQRLTPAQRTVFNLVEVEGYSLAECAEELKCSEVNVRVLLSRAKSQLRKELGNEKSEIE